MQLYQRYQERLQQHGFCADPAQQPILVALQHIADALAVPPITGWRRWLKQPTEPIPGLYIWGSVGRGKTWLMDLFFEHLPEPRKQRLHFHHFMQQVHQRLAQLKHNKEPLDQLAAQMAADWRILCLDEFHVIDIGDAMIFAGLLRGLFRRGLILVTTSNVPPSGLYPNGIQRDQFLPAIALLEQHTRVLAAGGEQDHRQAVAAAGQAYQYPLNVTTTQRLQHLFRQLAAETHDPAGQIRIQGRKINYQQRTPQVIWFEFQVLCGPPRSQHDYIALADQYAIVFISDIPAMTADDDDPMRRFIALIDELYDRRKQVVISAAVPAAELYQGDRLTFEFQRTLSRLHEMQHQLTLAK
jgi:cell division protein ZapE